MLGSLARDQSDGNPPPAGMSGMVESDTARDIPDTIGTRDGLRNTTAEAVDAIMSPDRDGSVPTRAGTSRGPPGVPAVWCPDPTHRKSLGLPKTRKRFVYLGGPKNYAGRNRWFRVTDAARIHRVRRHNHRRGTARWLYGGRWRRFDADRNGDGAYPGIPEGEQLFDRDRVADIIDGDIRA